MDKNSEKYRHQCEVRYLLRLRHLYGLQKFREYIRSDGFNKRRAKLLEDIADQWKKGNRGTVEGEWL